MRFLLITGCATGIFDWVASLCGNAHLEQDRSTDTGRDADGSAVDSQQAVTHRYLCALGGGSARHKLGHEEAVSPSAALQLKDNANRPWEVACPCVKNPLRCHSQRLSEPQTTRRHCETHLAAHQAMASISRPRARPQRHTPPCARERPQTHAIQSLQARQRD